MVLESIDGLDAALSSLATLQSQQALDLLLNIEQTMNTGRWLEAKIVLKSGPCAHPDFPKARTNTPLMLQVGKGAHIALRRQRSHAFASK